MKTATQKIFFLILLGLFFLSGRGLYAADLIKRLSVSPIQAQRDAKADDALPMIENFLHEMMSAAIADKKYKFILSDKPQLSIDITIDKCRSAAGEGVRKAYNIKAMGLSSTDASASIEATVFITDVDTNVPLDSQTFNKEASSQNAPGFFSLAWKGTLDEFRKDTPIGFACQSLVDAVTAYLLEKLDTIPWQGNIKSVDGNDIMLGYGDTDGIRDGNTFKVFRRGQSTYQSKLLGGTAQETLIAITRVEENFSMARPRVKGPFLFSAGDVIQQVKQ